MYYLKKIVFNFNIESSEKLVSKELSVEQIIATAVILSFYVAVSTA